jgi:hypothetical protein
MGADPRVNSIVGTVEGALPYGIGGVRPADAVSTTYKPHGKGIPYVSDVPFEEPYAERATCAGLRTNGSPCKAKARPGELTCEAHQGQG